MQEDRNRVCPVELSGSLDNKFRRWIQNPKKILAPYIKEGMKALDIGCGPGFFSIEMAKLAGQNGKVIAADLQEGMLQKIRTKIRGTLLEQIITLVKCEQNKINVLEKVDFILAFYMIHEVPDKENLFRELKNILSENGKMLIVEPPFHVSKKEFESTLNIAKAAGFKVNAVPKLFLNQTVILTNA
ncbi:MAG: class I SAM-dependent methyltransferase [Ignavibacteriales bacterium]|nr:class I SAM-dependent methyltransferase [Ignavibacteriales bacterium]